MIDEATFVVAQRSMATFVVAQRLIVVIIVARRRVVLRREQVCDASAPHGRLLRHGYPDPSRAARLADRGRHFLLDRLGGVPYADGKQAAEQRVDIPGREALELFNVLSDNLFCDFARRRGRRRVGAALGVRRLGQRRAIVIADNNVVWDFFTHSGTRPSLGVF
jgi:hypothetical protein